MVAAINNISKIHRPSFVCNHLAISVDDFNIFFTGRDTECAWICTECSKAPTESAHAFIAAENELLAGFSDVFPEKVIGLPEVHKQLGGLKLTHDTCDIDRNIIDALSDIQPDPESKNHWFILLETGRFVRVGRDDGQVTEICTVADSAQYRIDKSSEFRISNRGDYIATFRASERFGLVVELPSGRIVHELDRGAYKGEYSYFPFCFVEAQGKTLFVTATSWNKLEIIDPVHGELLTKRHTPEPEPDKKPEHNLDYFHARLTPSPGSAYILDDGWVWAPVGLLRTWNLPQWLNTNPWESEDGDSLRILSQCAGLWDRPTCWKDDSTLIVWGWGDFDEYTIPAARVFDVKTGTEKCWFSGPEVRPQNGLMAEKSPPSFIYDQYLFSVSHKCGLQIWDAERGLLLLEEPSAIPISYHPLAKEFLSLTDRGFTFTRVVPAT